MNHVTPTLRVPIKLTEQDVLSGCRNQCDSCPLTLALTRALNVTSIQHFSVMILQDQASFCGAGSAWVARMPEKLRQFVAEFDGGTPLSELADYVGEWHELRFTPINPQPDKVLSPSQKLVEPIGDLRTEIGTLRGLESEED